MAVQGTSDNTIIIAVDLQAQDAEVQAQRLGTQIQKLTSENKALRKSEQENTVEFQKNRQQIIALQREQRAYVTLTQSQTGSNVQLRAQLLLLTKQYDEMGKAERDGTTAGKALQLQIAAINKEISASEQNTGRFHRNVGAYGSNVGSAIQQFASSNIGTPGGLGFLPQALTAPVTNFVKTIGFATQAVKDNQTAEQLRQIQIEKTSEATEKLTDLEELKAEVVAANTKAERLATEASASRAEADELRLQVERQLVEQEEAEVVILQQLALEEQAIIAEEELRLAQEQALVLVNQELITTEEARVAQESALAAETAATAAATQAATSRTAAFGTASTVAGGLIVAAFAAAAAAIYTAISRLDTFSDSLEQKLSYGKGVVTGWGQAFADTFDKVGKFSDIFKAKTYEAFDGIIAKTKQAGQAAKDFTEIFQNLGDLKEVNDLANEVTQNEVANLRLQARNRKLSNDEKQKLLNEADQMERNQFQSTQSLHATILAEQVEYASKSVNGYAQLTKDQAAQLRNGNLLLANQLLNEGKITKDAYDRLKDAYHTRNADVQQANQALEKIQNDQDKYAEKAAQQEQKRQEDLNKIAEDRAKSRLASAQSVLTDSQKEVEQINLDINKREALYRKYNQSTVDLELERESRIKAVADKFREQDLKQIQQYTNEAATIRISLIKDGQERQAAQQQQADVQALQQVDNQILAISARMALGETGLNDLLQAAVDKRQAITDAADQHRIDNTIAAEDKLQKARLDGEAATYQAQVDYFNFETEQNAERLSQNEALIGSYQSVADAVASAFGKQTAIGKAAIIASALFAAAEIAIQYERARAAVHARYEILKAQAAAIPIAGVFAVAALTAAEAVEVGKITGEEIASLATLAIGTVAKFAQGGVHSGDGMVRGKGTGTSDSINARLSDGESVINARSTAMFKPLLSDINVAGGGRAFAQGGVYGGTYISGLGSQSNYQSAINAAVREGMRGVKIQVAVTDINDGQNKLAEVVQNANF
jgi:hypothetical protein